MKIYCINYSFKNGDFYSSKLYAYDIDDIISYTGKILVDFGGGSAEIISEDGSRTYIDR